MNELGEANKATGVRLTTWSDDAKITADIAKSSV